MMNDTSCYSLSLGNSDSMVTDYLQARVILAAVFSLVAAVTVLGNVTVISALVRFRLFASKTKDASNNTQLLMISMAVSDAVLGGAIMPFGIYNVIKNRRWELGISLCNVREVSDIILSAVSFFHVTCMALDRYLAVCRPLLFRTLTTKATLLMISGCWILPSAFVLTIVLSGWHTIGIEHIVYCSTSQTTCVFLHNKQSLLVFVLVLLDCPLLATFVLYFLVLREVKKYHKRKPAIYCNQEKPKLKMELRYREVIGRKSLNGSSLTNKSRDNDVELTSKDEKNISFQWGLLHCFGSWFSQRSTEPINGRYPGNITEPQVLCKPHGIERKYTGHKDTDFSIMMLQPEFRNKPIVLQENNAKMIKTSRFTHEISGGNRSTDSDNKKLPPRMAAGRSRSNIKAVTTIGIIVACFTVCWLPLNVAVLVNVPKNHTNPTVSLFVIWLSYVNSMFNPMIYCCQRSIRSAVWSVMCPTRCAFSR